MVWNPERRQKIMKKRRAVIAAILCGIMALFMLSSSVCLTLEILHGHDCAGEECPVCRLLSQVVQLRRTMGELHLAAALAAFCACAFGMDRIAAEQQASGPDTLITCKIRSND